MKAFFDEATVSSPSPPIEERSLVHTVEACWRCTDVRSIAQKGFVTSADGISLRAMMIEVSQQLR
jgi:hypothetical protein